jgi:hypothetical protein
VTSRTRAFERHDALIVAGAGGGSSPAEAAAAERAGRISDDVREAYKEMLYRGAHQRGEGRIGL